MNHNHDLEQNLNMEELAPASASAVTADKTAKLHLINRCLAIVVCTQNFNWDNDEYQKGVVEPYRKIQQMLEELEKEDKEPTPAQLNESLEMLRRVFATKRTPVAEQARRFHQIFDETGTRSLFPDFKFPA